MAKISAVLVTLNNEDKIKKCLSSIRWVDEIIVFDLESTDKTKKICQEFGAKIFSHQKVEYVEILRNESIQKANGEWILILDPDEEIPSLLGEKLQEVVKKNEVEAVLIPRKNFIFGKFITHSAWWPDYKIRFFKKGKVFWNGQIHLDGKPTGKILKLPPEQNLAILHYSYPDLTSFLERMDRYTTIEAEEKFKNKEKFSLSKMLFSMTYEFGKRFIKGRAFLDGVHGIILTILMIYYQFLVWGKVWEKENKK